MKTKKYPKYTIVLRGYSFEQAHAILEAMSGLENNFAVEITMNTQNAVEDITKLSSEFGDKITIGAGTVLTFKDEINAIDAGAKFILSACAFNKHMIEYAKRKKVITVPGVLTPNEIFKMLNYGADIIKVFPASTVGPKYFGAIQAPLGKIPLMAVGGISKDNVHDFFENGAQFAGIGSSAFRKEDVFKQDVNKLHKALIDLVKKA